MALQSSVQLHEGEDGHKHAVIQLRDNEVVTVGPFRFVFQGDARVIFNRYNGQFNAHASAFVIRIDDGIGGHRDIWKAATPLFPSISAENIDSAVVIAEERLRRYRDAATEAIEAAEKEVAYAR
jgi:hypothetical protein